MSTIDLFAPLVTGKQETSREAAEAIAPKRGTQRFRVLAWLVANGPAVEESVTRWSGVHQNGGRLRLAELAGAGLVERTGETGTTSAGHKAYLWRATPAGYRAIRDA